MEAIDSDSRDNMDVDEIYSEDSSVSECISDCSDESENDSADESQSEDSQVPGSVNDGTDKSKSSFTRKVISDKESINTFTEQETSEEEEASSCRSRPMKQDVSETLVGRSERR